MNKVGIKKVGFVEQNEINDGWVEQQQPEQRGLNNVVIPNAHWFASCDQSASSLFENLVDEPDGVCFEASLQVTFRTVSDIEMAKRYTRRPVVMYVETVDGCTYSIGTKEYPVRMILANSYDGISSRSCEINVSYRTLTGILQ